MTKLVLPFIDGLKPVHQRAIVTSSGRREKRHKQDKVEFQKVADPIPWFAVVGEHLSDGFSHNLLDGSRFEKHACVSGVSRMAAK